ncbi:MAG: PAS domain S-box protein [Thermodesulfovibrionales bacterium]|jgi:PAS domain S-box-containing protein
MKLGMKITVVFVLGLLIIGVVGIQSYLEIQRVTETNRLVIHTHEVIENLEHVLSVLKDAETGQRGFVLTGEDPYLEPYNAATREILKDIEAVASLTRDNPEQQKSLQQLLKLSHDKLDVLQDTIKLRREGGMKAALPVIRSDRGKRIMDEIRVLMDQMESRERELLEARNHAAGAVARRSVLTLGFSVLLSLAVLGIAAVIVTNTMRLADRSPVSKDSGRRWVRIAAQYTFAVAAVALATGLRSWLVRSFGPMPIFLTWYPAVLLVATIAGGGPGVVATFLSVLAADYWFIEPVGSLSIASANDAVSLGIFAGTGIFLSALAERLQRARRTETISVTREKELALLNMGNLMALDLDHRIVRWSEGNSRLYGYDAQEAQGQLTYELLQTHFAEPQKKIQSELLEKGHWEGEVTRCGRDGTQLSVAILWALRRDEHGKPLAILEVSTDITRQKLAEESLRQQSEELAQQNEELSRQSEELTLQSEELSEQNEELQTQSEEIQALNAELGQREKTLQTLLDFARLPIGEREVMEKICHAALEMIGPPVIGAAVCEAHDDELCILAYAGFEGADVPRCWPAKGSFAEIVIQQDRTASLEDTSLRPDLNILSVPGHQRFGAVLSSPLHVSGRPIGTVSIYSNRRHQWTVEHFRLIEWLAAQCSNTLKAMRLAGEVSKGQKQNEFLANILAASSQAFGVGYPDGRLGLTNKAFEQLTGYSDEELRSIDWATRLTPPEWLEVERQKLDELNRTGLPVRYEKEYMRKDGTRVPIELLVHLVKDAEGKPLYYYSFLTDITEHKRAGETLRRSEKRYRELFENMIEGFAYCKMIFENGKPQDFTYLSVNHAFETLTGLKNVVGKRVTEVIPGIRETDPELIEIYGRVSLTGKPERFEMFVEALKMWFSISVYSPEEEFFVAVFDIITERKKAEEVQGRLAAIVDSAEDAIIGKDLNGIIHSWNVGAENIFGYKAEEVIGKPVSLLVPPGHTDEVPEILARIKQGEHIESFETVRMRKDGAIIPVSLTFSAIKDKAGRIIGASKIAHDITERKQAEEEREATVEFLRLVNESRGTGDLLRAATAFFQQRSGFEAVGIRLQEGHNYPYYETRGFPKEFVLAESSLCTRDRSGDPILDSIGNSFLECMCGNVICGRFDPSKPFFTQGGSFWTNSTTELLASTRDADRQTHTRNRCHGAGYESVGLFALRFGGESMGLLQLNDRRPGLFSPASIALWERLAGYLAVALSRFRAEQALRVSEERFRTLFETMTEGFSLDEIILDEAGKAVDLRYLSVNPAFERYTGLKGLDVVGRTTRELFPETEPIWFERYGKVALTGEPAHFEERFGPLDKWFEVSAYRTEPGRFAVVFFDITERKKYEQEVLKLSENMAARNVELEEANRELEGFSYSVSHDLRAPIRHITGFAELLQKTSRSQLDKTSLHYVSVISNAAKKMGILIDDLLAFSRIGRAEIQMKRVSLTALVREVVKEMRTEVQGRDIVWKIGELPEVYGDPSMLKLVLANLISNAVKFTRTRPRAEIEIGCREEKEESIFFVKDNGVGFDMKYGDKLFGVFQRLHSYDEFEGTGIGLANVRRIISRHEGRTWAEGFPGKGTVLYFTLPKIKDA